MQWLEGQQTANRKTGSRNKFIPYSFQASNVNYENYTLSLLFWRFFVERVHVRLIYLPLSTLFKPQSLHVFVITTEQPPAS